MSWSRPWTRLSRPAAIAARIAAHAARLVERVDATPGCRLLSPRDPGRRAGIVTFRPPAGDPAALQRALLADGVVCAARGGGLRLSPHFYNTMAEVERTLAAVGETMRAGAEERRGALGSPQATEPVGVQGAPTI